MKESTFTLSPKIGQADLQVKVTGIKNKARQVDRVNVQVKPKGCGEDQLKIFQSHIKTLLENEGLAVSEMKNEQWGLFVKALKEKS
ncbi:hypothetical protein EB796_007748 [Bugula neritina]|uniref:Uncharacterized protein n=1 Tax=Bugula neritina TaxID=10212 RepID=A0A7J7K6X7_BUGNE|nr:hypothetical protein EB796_007748 [Bugula neritina]